MDAKTAWTIFLFFSFATLVFTVVATPLPFVRGTANSDCKITLWKYSCNGGEVKVEDIKCEAAKTRLQAGEAFAIISIAVTLFTTLVGLKGFMSGSADGKIPAVILSFLGVGTTIITWGAVAALMTDVFCSGSETVDIGKDFSYAEGEGLFVVSFCLLVLNPIVLLVTLRSADATSSASASA